MHAWPARRKPPREQRSAAYETSASEWTITAPLPPSSSVTRGVAATPLRYQPTGALPVKETIRTRSSRTMRSASSLLEGKIVTASGGAPASSMIAPSASADSGVFGAGRTMHGLPAAKAGPILWATSSSGALKAVMPSTTPTGNLRVRPTRPAPLPIASIGTSSPEDERPRASAAENSKISAVRSTSARESSRTMPVSSVI